MAPLFIQLPRKSILDFSLIHPISPETSGHCTSFTHILSSNPLLSLWQVLNEITYVKYLEHGPKYCKSTCLSLPLGSETRDYNWSIFKPPESSTWCAYWNEWMNEWQDSIGRKTRKAIQRYISIPLDYGLEESRRKATSKLLERIDEPRWCCISKTSGRRSKLEWRPGCLKGSVLQVKRMRVERLYL